MPAMEETFDPEAEYVDISSRNAWPLVFQRISRECRNHRLTCWEAMKPQNKPLNRYRDVHPYDHTRVILERSETDYINANVLTIERARRSYILTQGPLPLTVGHFWLMVWERNSRAIIMLNKIIEKNEIKCHWYWPQGVGPEHRLTLTDVKLAVEQIKEEDCGYYTTRLFRIIDLEGSDTREVIQFHYTTWPDFGVPSSPDAFLDFLTKVRDEGVLEADVGPAVVHCSAGIGRSGTFCLVDSCLVMVSENGLNSIDIQRILIKIRRDRMGLIQTPDQLRFSYEAVLAGAKRLDPNRHIEPVPMEEIYTSVPLEPEPEREEEAPPPPPPRGESLAAPPERPLPAIPASASMVNLDFSSPLDSSDSDIGPPTPPPHDAPVDVSSADDEDDDMKPSAIDSEPPETLRRRRMRDLSERVASMKRKARDAERWHKIKRSLYKPLTITFGLFIAGLVLYTYIKR